MPTYSNDLHDIRSTKASTCRHYFITGALGEATYFASLRILGLSPDDARAEVQSALEERNHTNGPRSLR